MLRARRPRRPGNRPPEAWPRRPHRQLPHRCRRTGQVSRFGVPPDRRPSILGLLLTCAACEGERPGQASDRPEQSTSPESQCSRDRPSRHQESAVFGCGSGSTLHDLSMTTLSIGSGSGSSSEPRRPARHPDLPRHAGHDRLRRMAAWAAARSVPAWRGVPEGSVAGPGQPLSGPISGALRRADGAWRGHLGWPTVRRSARRPAGRQTRRLWWLCLLAPRSP